MLPQTRDVCYGDACPREIPTPVIRFLAVFVAAATVFNVSAADKQARMRAKAAIVAPAVDKNGDPILQSSGVLVLDANTGNTLYSKNADHQAPIASITKLMTAMVVVDAKLPMDEVLQISSEDLDLIKNTKSRLPVGAHFRRDDLMRLALMASDNRAASALGRNYPGGILAFVDAMNAKAKVLGLTATHYVDSSGLAPGNVSSAQDLGKLVGEASKYELIREYTTTAAVSVQLPEAKKPLTFVNTNSLVRASDWQIGLSKTGYINESGKCLVMQAMIANQPIVIVLLDSWGRLTRVGDAIRIRKWLEKNPSRLVSSTLPNG
jgi:D-alanyl-D-alanine endopeptidase (penicillin-binding protein 7)